MPCARQKIANNCWPEPWRAVNSPIAISLKAPSVVLNEKHKSETLTKQESNLHLYDAKECWLKQWYVQ